MPTRTWHPVAEEMKVRMFVNYKLFGIFVKSIADVIIKGMARVKDVDFHDGYCFVSVDDTEEQ